MKLHLVEGWGRSGGLSGLLLALLSAGPGAAADSGTPQWSGWYIGGAIAGYSAEAVETERLVATDAVSAIYGYSGDGVSAGLFFGHAWQSDDLVFGVEVGMRAGESVTLDFGSADNFYIYDAGPTMSIEGRVGYLVRPDTQVFASAGLSTGRLNYDWTAAGNRETGGLSSTGYTIGFGVERWWGDNGALRLGVDYTARDTGDFVTGLFPDNRYDTDLELVRVTVGYSLYLGR